MQVLLGTACVDARVALLERERLAPGSVGLAQLRLREPVAAARGDRAILRTTAPPATIAGAVVLDPAPQRHGGRASDIDRMRLLAGGDVPSLVRAALQGAKWPVPLGRIAPAGLLEATAAREVLDALSSAGELIALPGADPAWLTAARYDELRHHIRDALVRRAREHPLEPALPAAAVAPAGPGADALLARLAADGVLERDGAHVVLRGAGADAHGSHADEAEAVLEALARGGFSPPDLPALQRASALPEREFTALCAALERSGALVRFGGDLAYTAERFAEARDLVVAHCGEHGSIALAELRDALGASRRIAQALLERLDADGTTRRVEDRRVLRRRAPR